MAAATRVSLIAAASVGMVEALKDQVGLCRWNYALRSLHQHARNNLGPLSRAAAWRSSGQSASGCAADERLRRREAERAEKVVHLICWGPN